MLTRTEMKALQDQMNRVFETHWNRIDKLEMEVAKLKDAAESTKAKPSTKHVDALLEQMAEAS